MKPIGPNQLWVSDITYIKTIDEVLYLFLITDAYSKKIVGFCLADTLEASNAVIALKMAFKQKPKVSSI
ncbi:MAG: transposase family protein [Saprospiraceae bacterium]|nr:transposase family protein [Saprospiraceae bacterium]